MPRPSTFRREGLETKTLQTADYNQRRLVRQADMCRNCALWVKGMKFGTKIAFVMFLIYDIVSTRIAEVTAFRGNFSKWPPS